MHNGEDLLVTLTVASGPQASIPTPDLWVRVHSWKMVVGGDTRRAGMFWVVSWEEEASGEGELDSVELTHLDAAARELDFGGPRNLDVRPLGDELDWPSWVTLGCWRGGRGGMLHVKVGDRGFVGADQPAFTRLLRVVRDICNLESQALAWM